MTDWANEESDWEGGEDNEHEHKAEDEATGYPDRHGVCIVYAVCACGASMPIGKDSVL